MTEPLRHGVQRYRVAQWATGNIGARTMRAVLEHPNLTLAGGVRPYAGQSGPGYW
jgi:4-hydroxy-tetrahydrodipicolinate reductase